MKTFILLFSLLVCKATIAQNDHLIPKEKWSKNFYISDEFCAAKGLTPGETNDRLRVWNSNMSNSGFVRLVDIRWYFNTPAEAEQYLKNNMPSLSETGDPVKEKVNIGNVTNLYIFDEGAGMRSMNASLGITLNSYNFLFTVKNYLAKTYVSSEKPITLAEAATFAKEAAERLNAAVK